MKWKNVSIQKKISIVISKRYDTFEIFRCYSSLFAMWNKRKLLLWIKLKKKTEKIIKKNYVDM